MILNSILFGCHVIVYFLTTPIRASIYFYIKRKPPGLQSVLDLLIIELLRTHFFTYTFFIFCFLFPGFFYGQLPYVLSQVIIFLLYNSSLYFFGLLQSFLVTKAILVFKGQWLNEVSDSTVIWLSRILALVIVTIRFLGDFMVNSSREATMTLFLTSTDSER